MSSFTSDSIHSSSSSPSPSSTHASVTASSLATLFHVIPASVVCSFLCSADLLTVCSVDRATRRLILSSPAVWRDQVFTSFPPPAFSSLMPSSLSSPSPISLLQPICDVVQVVISESLWGGQPESCLPTFASIARCPHLRRVDTTYKPFSAQGACQHTASVLITPPLTLLPMRYLICLSLFVVGEIRVVDMRLISTLPVLKSFGACRAKFESGSEDTLQQWQALTANKQGRGKRKADQLSGDGLEQDMQENDEEMKEEEGQHLSSLLQEQDASKEDANDPSLHRKLKHSALLLFLHALAAKPSLVHLDLAHAHLTPFIFDHMPVWPHLLSLDVRCNDGLLSYRFHKAAVCFPSLTSLSSPNCSDAAIAHIVQMPALEELWFPNYQTKEVYEEFSGNVLTTTEGFRTFSLADKLRSLCYSPPAGNDVDEPSDTALTSILTLTNLTRVTLSASWCVDGLFVHHFEHLRCLELEVQMHWSGDICDQTDDTLMPFVKPLHVMVDGRERRQAARVAKRQVADKDSEGKDADSADIEQAAIPVNNAANFPSLECLALPYEHYGRGGNQSGDVSQWIMSQLRRSYEYEVAAEWEAECTTLGVAELLKSIMA